MMVSFVLSFFPRDVLDEILNLIESVSEDFPSYSSIAKSVSLFSAHHPDMTSILLNRTNTARHPSFNTDQLSPLEGYSLTLCAVTSRIKADRLSISVKCLTGILHIPSSLVLR